VPQLKTGTPFVQGAEERVDIQFRKAPIVATSSDIEKI
jgi:hypothetical protein